MNIKGFIFDFNGVLWWDTSLQEQAWKDFSKSLREKEFSEEEMSTHVHGRNNKHSMEYLLGREITEKELMDLTEGKESAYRKLCLEAGKNFQLSPGAIELIDYLNRHGIPFTIATASEINNLKFFFEHLNLDKWFDFSKVVYDDGTIPGKPAPDIYIKAAKILNVNPADCAVVEDARSGIKAAHAANIGTIIALGSEPMRNTLLGFEGVKYFVRNLGEVRNILEEI